MSLKGYRTVLFNVATILLIIGEELMPTGVIATKWLALVLAVGNIMLRTITTTEIFKDEEI